MVVYQVLRKSPQKRFCRMTSEFEDDPIRLVSSNSNFHYRRDNEQREKSGYLPGKRYSWADGVLGHIPDTAEVADEGADLVTGNGTGGDLLRESPVQKAPRLARGYRQQLVTPSAKEEAGSQEPIEDRACGNEVLLEGPRQPLVALQCARAQIAQVLVAIKRP
jgi:hypothetical protein